MQNGSFVEYGAGEQSYAPSPSTYQEVTCGPALGEIAPDFTQESKAANPYLRITPQLNR